MEEKVIYWPVQLKAFKIVFEVLNKIYRKYTNNYAKLSTIIIFIFLGIIWIYESNINFVQERFFPDTRILSYRPNRLNHRTPFGICIEQNKTYRPSPPRHVIRSADESHEFA